MRYRTLGRTGVKVSEIGFGGAGTGLRNYIVEWDVSQAEQARTAERAIERAVELGVTYFDTAPLYGSEPLFGRALKPHRDKVFIATKVREPDADGVRRSVEASLERLQTDHLDLIQHHGEWYSDELLHDFLKPGGILDGLRAVRDEGLVRFIGFTSQGTDGNVSRLIGTGEFDVLQIQYNVMFQHPYDPEKRHGVMFEAEAQEMGIVVMRSMTGGVLMRWLEWIDPGIGRRVDLPKALLSFVLSNPLTDVALVGMRYPEWVEANCAVVDDESSRIDLNAMFKMFTDR